MQQKRGQLYNSLCKSNTGNGPKKPAYTRRVDFYCMQVLNAATVSVNIQLQPSLNRIHTYAVQELNSYIRTEYFFYGTKIQTHITEVIRRGINGEKR
jgi:hypothetical protein